MMKQGLVSLTIVLLTLVAQQQAGCAPPDQVANSPVPSLQQPQQKTVWTEPTPLVPLRMPRQPLRPQTLPIKQRDSVPPSPQAPPHEEYDSEHSALWNSPEMQAARSMVKEFCERAAQTSPQEGAEFLEQLARLSHEQMEDWLKRFQSRRRNVSRGNEVGQLARLMNVGRSLRQIQAKQQVAQNVALQRRQAAAARASSLSTQPLGQGMVLVPIDASGMSTLRYQPMEAVVDPSSPRGYGRKVAAAMSLPGDLPRSDPRNYIRGEAGVDFGEWATSRRAVPPTPTPAPALP